MKPKLPLSDHLAYAATLFVGLGTVVLAAGFPRPEDAHSGPGSFPLAVGCLMILVALAGWIVGWCQKPDGDPAPATDPAAAETAEPPAKPAQTWLLAGLTAVYLLVLPHLGFISATALLGAGSLVVLGERRLPQALAVGFLFGFALYGVFGLLMNVPLPEGVIG